MKRALIIGAGPAGVTAALELLRTTDIQPLVVEAEEFIGGISRTAEFGGYRIDTGIHRFFSKSDRVNEWWLGLLKPQGAPSPDYAAIGHPSKLVPGGPDPEKEDKVMLFRSRLSRILYGRKLFDYPVSLNATTIRNLGIPRMAKIGVSYLRACLCKKREERSLEDFMVNRFGVELYKTFFKEYTEKVWGVPCSEISAEWGAQRIKGLSVGKTIAHALRALLPTGKGKAGKAEKAGKGGETSLIGEFLYPKLGAGQIWEAAAEEVVKLGGEVRLGTKAVGFACAGNKVTQVMLEGKDGTGDVVEVDYVLSSMPIKDLVAALPGVPGDIAKIAQGLIYRDFMTAGVVLEGLELKNPAKKGTPESRLPHPPDSWIYVQEGDVKLGRFQIFNNWSPYLFKDRTKLMLGLEYFVNEGDELWTMKDEDFLKFAMGELEQIGVAKRGSLVEGKVFRVPKAYPAYFGTYSEFPKLRAHLDTYENLYLMGRNGMHKYNNMDHSMLTAMEAVKCLREGLASKASIWNVNTEQEYHETKAG